MNHFTTLLRRLPGAVWTLLWMWPLIGAVLSITQGKVPHAGWAAIGLASFTVLYLIIVTNAFDEHREPNPPIDVSLLMLSAAVGLTLLWAYGRYDQWPNIILYVAIAGVVMLRIVAAVTWVVAICAIFLAYCTIGPGRGAGIDEWASLTFGILLASALVFTIRRMIVYISQLRSTRVKLAQTAVSEERLRFARDLHDLLGHTLSLVVVKAEVVRRLVEHDPAAAAREAAEIEAIGRQALAEIRDAVSGYREPGLATEVDAVRSALMDAGIAVSVTMPSGTLASPANTLFGWAVREASTNVIRHSRAKNCSIVVTSRESMATLSVSDDGVGASVGAGKLTGDGTGTGLLGLRERFAAAGGTVETSSQPGRGFRLIATAPLTVCAEAENPVPA